MDEKHIGYWTEWLVSSVAPTITGSKPSTVLTLSDTRTQPLLTIWRKAGHLVLAGTILQYKILQKSKEKETVLFYRPDILQQCMAECCHKNFLEQLGYPVASGFEACLDMLAHRFRHCCPHEVGVLLGIPLNDVLGFMKIIDLPLTCRREWCVYGDPEKSLAVMKQYADDRKYIDNLISKGFKPYQILCGNWAILSRSSKQVPA